MKEAEGKITIGNLLIFCIIIYGAFAAFKIIGANMEEKSVSKEVYDFLGTVRGAAFTEELGVIGIKDILEKHNLKGYKEPVVQINREKGKIYYFVSYDTTIDLLFFQRKKTVELENELDTYGL